MFFSGLPVHYSYLDSSCSNVTFSKESNATVGTAEVLGSESASFALGGPFGQTLLTLINPLIELSRSEGRFCSSSTYFRDRTTKSPSSREILYIEFFHWVGNGH